MRNALFVLVSANLLAAAIAACAGSGSVGVIDLSSDGGDPNSSSFPQAAPVPNGGAAGAAGTGLATGLPCDVQAILENRCIACHDGKTAPPMLDFNDLTAPSTAAPTKSRAALALEYLQAKTMPPLPAEAPADDEVASFDAWVKGGVPRNSVACTDAPPPSVDGGTVADGGAICTSNMFWTKQEDGSEEMHPGRACNACHQQEGGPNLRIAGTVFPTLHETDDCNGAPSTPKLTVIITDAKNKSFRLNANSVGNFFTQSRVTPPLRAQITDGTKTRSMQGTVSSGDCNSCHTVLGLNGAPGRIMAP